MKLRYIDVRPKASNGVFDMEIVAVDTVRLIEVDSRRTYIVGGEDFKKNYEPINWPE